MATMPTIIFDFINKAIITAGVNADADKKVQDFVAQQAKAAATAGGTTSR